LVGHLQLLIIIIIVVVVVVVVVVVIQTIYSRMPDMCHA
jgi:hypothetical protein